MSTVLYVIVYSLYCTRCMQLYYTYTGRIAGVCRSVYDGVGASSSMCSLWSHCGLDVRPATGSTLSRSSPLISDL